MSQAIRKLEKGDNIQQQPEEKLFKDGNRSVSLGLIQKNANQNIQKYLDSKSWNKRKKQEFMNAYSNFLTQLDNGTISERNIAREYVDSSGKITNLTGKGFDAYGEAARFIDSIVDAMPDYSKPEVKKQKYDNDDIYKFFTKRTFGGNDPNMTIWQDRDQVIDEKTGKRQITNRANYFADILKDYAASIQNSDFDFEGSAFTNKQDLLNRLKSAETNLRSNEFNNDDLSSVLALGLNGDLVKKLFSDGTFEKREGSPENPLTESEQYIEDEKKKAEQEKIDQQAAILRRNNAIKEKLRAEYSDPVKNFQRRELSLPTPQTMESLWSKGVSFNPSNTTMPWGGIDFSQTDLTKITPQQWDNLSNELQNILKNNNLFESTIPLQNTNNFNSKVFGKDMNQLDYVSSVLSFLNNNGMLDTVGKDAGDGWYYIPSSEKQGRVLLYNPSSGKLAEEAVYKTPYWQEVQKRFLDEANKNDFQFNFKVGGILKYQNGGFGQKMFDKLQADKKKQESAKQEEQALKEAQYRENPNLQYDESGKEKWSDHSFSQADWTRLGAVGMDVVSLVANLTGVGSVASAGLGAAASGMNQYADSLEGKKWGFTDYLANYGMDALSVLPFVKAAKIPKMVKTLGSFAPKIIGILGTAQGIANSPQYIESWSKIGKEDLTVQDWRNIADSIKLVVGTGVDAGRASRANKKVNAALSDTHQWVKTNNGYRKVANEDIEQLNKFKTLEEQNKFLKEKYQTTLSRPIKLFGKKPVKADVKTTDYYDFSKPVTLYSGDLPYNAKFSWGEKMLGNLQPPTVNIGVRNAYNRVVHPQAYKRRKNELTQQNPETKKSLDSKQIERLKALREKTLNSRDIKLINEQRKIQGKPELTPKEIEALKNRRGRNDIDFINQKRAERGEARMSEEEISNLRQRRGNSVIDPSKRFRERLYEYKQKKTKSSASDKWTVEDAMNELKTAQTARQTKNEAARKAVEANADKVRERQLIELAERAKAARVYTPEARKPLSGAARTAKEKSYDQIFNKPWMYNINTVTTDLDIRPSIPKVKKPMSGARRAKKQALYERLFPPQQVTSSTPTMPKSEKGLQRQERKQKALEEALEKQRKNAEPYVSKSKLKDKKQKKHEKTSRDDKRTVRRLLGGTLLHKYIIKAQGGTNTSRFSESFMQDYKPLVTTVSSEKEKYGKVKRGKDYSFNTNSRLSSVLDLLKNNKLTLDDVSMMQRRHAGMYSTYNPEWSPVYNDLVKQYQNDYQSLGLNDLIIAPNYTTNYQVMSSHPNSGDRAKTWTADGRYDAITDDRRILARKEDYLNSDGTTNQKLLNQDIEAAKAKGYNYYLDPDSGYYMLSRVAPEEIKSDKGTIEKPETTPGTNSSRFRAAIGGDSQTGLKWLNALTDQIPNFISVGRLASNIANNNRVTRETLKGIKPLLVNTYNLQRYITGDLATKQGYYNRASQLQSLAGKSRTADASLQLAGELEAANKGNELKAQGDLADNEMIRKTSDQAWQAEADNLARRTEVANRNREALLKTAAAKHNIEAARMSANHVSLDTFWKEQEQRLRNKLDQEREFRLGQTKQNLDYMLDDPQLKALQDKIMSAPEGTDITMMPEYKQYQALKKSLLNKYTEEYNKAYANIYGFRNWGRPAYNPVYTFRDGGNVDVAKIRAKTESAKLFQKNIQDTIKNHIHMIDNLSQLTKELILKSMSV